MKSKFLNLFWVLLAFVVIINEFLVGELKMVSISNLKWSAWLLIFIWSLIALKNVYSFFTKTNKA